MSKLFVDHRVRCSAGAVSVLISAPESGMSARKTLETFWTAAMSPGINQKEKWLKLAKELGPFESSVIFDLHGVIRKMIKSGGLKGGS